MEREEEEKRLNRLSQMGVELKRKRASTFGLFPSEGAKYDSKPIFQRVLDMFGKKSPVSDNCYSRRTHTQQPLSEVLEEPSPELFSRRKVFPDDDLEGEMKHMENQHQQGVDIECGNVRPTTNQPDSLLRLCSVGSNP